MLFGPEKRSLVLERAHGSTVGLGLAPMSLMMEEPGMGKGLVDGARLQVKLFSVPTMCKYEHENCGAFSVTSGQGQPIPLKLLI